jgi:hypothetical protein
MVEARSRAIHGTLGANHDAPRRGLIVTSTSSFLPRRAAWAGKLIEDSCHKAVGVVGRPVRVAVGAVTVPIEVAKTSFNILRLSEELLEEVVFLLRSMRPVVEAVSTVQQADNFESVYRTLEQIQHSAQAPIGVVRSVLTPVRPSRDGRGPRARVIEPEPQLQTPSVIRIASITDADDDDRRVQRPGAHPGGGVLRGHVAGGACQAAVMSLGCCAATRVVFWTWAIASPG